MDTKHELKKGERVRIIDRKPARHRKKRIAKAILNHKKKGVIISRKNNLDYNGVSAFEVSIKRRKSNLVAYKDELAHLLDTPPYSYMNGSNGKIYFYRDSCGVKRCPECGKEIDDYDPRKYCCREHQKKSSDRAYFRRRRMKDKERREYVKNFCREWRKEKKEEGLCIRCGKNVPSPGYAICCECREVIDMYNY